MPAHAREHPVVLASFGSALPQFRSTSRSTSRHTTPLGTGRVAPTCPGPSPEQLTLGPGCDESVDVTVTVVAPMS